MPRQRSRHHPGFCQALGDIDVVLPWIELNQKLHATRRRRNAQAVPAGDAERLHQQIPPGAIDTRHLADMCGEITIVDEFGQGILQWNGNDLSAVTLCRFEYIHQILRHDRIADANVREHRFGERADIEDAAGVVEPLQGGIDADENPREAVMRELWEETGAASADYLGETDWLTYEFPDFAGPSSHRLAKFRGQRQKWFALRFTGSDADIDPLTPRNGQPAEFDQWRWERLDRVADLVVPFRREVYRAVAQSFAKFANRE